MGQEGDRAGRGVGLKAGRVENPGKRSPRSLLLVSGGSLPAPRAAVQVAGASPRFS